MKFQLQLPDVSPTINKLDQLELDEIQRAASEGIKKLNKIEDDIKVRLTETLDEANSQVKSAGKLNHNL